MKLLILGVLLILPACAANWERYSHSGKGYGVDIAEPHPRPPAFMLEPRFSEWRNECYASLHDEIRQAMATEGNAS